MHIKCSVIWAQFLSHIFKLRYRIQILTYEMGHFKLVKNE